MATNASHSTDNPFDNRLNMLRGGFHEKSGETATLPSRLSRLCQVWSSLAAGCPSRGQPELRTRDTISRLSGFMKLKPRVLISSRFREDSSQNSEYYDQIIIHADPIVYSR